MLRNYQCFDDFILSVKKASKESATKSLEILDKHIYLNIDHKRFRLVRNSPRTILTTIGAITFRRRYYEDLEADRDADEGHYVCPLDEVMGLPRYSRYSNELRINIEIRSILLDNYNYE
jgi:hypothetical protein